MARKKAKLYRERGKTQRSHLTLTQEIASSLYEKVRRGGKLWNKEEIIELPVYKGTDVQIVKIPYTTYNNWITRGNCIKGTDTMLRDTLDEAREKSIELKQKERRKKMLDQAENNLVRISKMRTTEAITTVVKGKVRYHKNPDGTPMRKVNTKLVGIVAKTSEYITSTLANETYNKLEKKETKNLTFSLSDLRKEQEGN